MYTDFYYLWIATRQEQAKETWKNFTELIYSFKKDHKLNVAFTGAPKPKTSVTAKK